MECAPNIDFFNFKSTCVLETQRSRIVSTLEELESRESLKKSKLQRNSQL